MTAAGDQDNELKERIARVLFAQGHLCRFNVDVVGGDAPSSEVQYTDVDVIATSFDRTLVRHLILADCKSGRDGKPRERIFWLSGVKTRFQADRAYFVKTTVEPGPFNIDYEKLDLRILSQETLETLETLTKASDFDSLGPVSKGALVAADDIHRKFKEINKPAYRYLKYLYWQDTPQAQLENLIPIIRDIKAKEAAYARYAAVALASLSALSFASKAAAHSPGRRGDAVKVDTAGADIQRLQPVIAGMYRFTAAEIKEHTRKNWKTDLRTFMAMLEPKHAAPLADLVERILANPAAHALPQAIDIVAYESQVSMRTPKLDVLHDRTVTSDALRQGIGDLLAFLERAGALTLDERRDMMSSVP